MHKLNSVSSEETGQVRKDTTSEERARAERLMEDKTEMLLRSQGALSRSTTNCHSDLEITHMAF